MPEFRRNRSPKPDVVADPGEAPVAALVYEQRDLEAKMELMRKLLSGGDAGVSIDRLPRMDEIAMAELSRPQQYNYLMLVRTLTQRAMSAMAPAALVKMAKKMENHLEPGDTRLLVEYMKGMGYFSPATPMTESERDEKTTKLSTFDKMTRDELLREVMEGMK